jgi:predicted amidohydrolase YtcJ
VLIRQATVYGNPALPLMDIRCGERIEDMATQLAPHPQEQVIDANGAVVMPGLHDHHIHFRALAAVQASIACGPPAVNNATQLAVALTKQNNGPWIRGIGYHDSIAGPLNREWLDNNGPQAPIRIQHQSGKCWILNSIALELLQLASHDTDERFERDAAGVLTGRLFRLDEWLRERLRNIDNPLYPLSDIEAAGTIATSTALLAVGITSFTDTSATNNQAAVHWFREQQEFGNIRQRVCLMGDETLNAGHLKILLDEDTLPDIDELITTVQLAHAHARPVAFHCVTATELVVAMHTLEAAGTHPQDRLEHASLVDADQIRQLSKLKVTVVTQPGFIADRGDRYRQDLAASQQVDLYRYRSLLDAGIQVACSSDAPYGPYSPWQVIAAAQMRRTPMGEVLGPAECVSASAALRSYLSSAAAPAGPLRQLSPGSVADLVMLDRSWEEFLNDPKTTSIRYTVLGGELVYTG